MATHKFKVGSIYQGQEIQLQLGPGNYSQVVVLSRRKGVLCIRFRTRINPAWEKKNELWIHHGENQIRDAQRWIENGAIVPIFCSEGRSNNWIYQGDAYAELLAIEDAAKVYTGEKSVGLVLRMNYRQVKSASVTKIRRKETHPTSEKKRAS